MIKSNEMYFTVSVMCRLLWVSRSGYYSWRNRPLSDRDQANQLLLIDIRRVFDEEKGRPGSPRISKRLQDEGKSASRHRVAKLMRDNCWRAKAARKYKATTNSNHLFTHHSLAFAYNNPMNNCMAKRSTGYF